jgi:hypothetical protein
MKIELAALTEQAQKTQQICRIIIWPNLDIVPNVDALDDYDNCIQFAFEPVLTQ